MVDPRFRCAAIALVSVLAAPSTGLAAGEPRALTDVLHVHPGATCAEEQGLADQVAAWLGTGQVDPDIAIDVEGSPDDPRVASFEMRRGGTVVARRRFDPGPVRCDHFLATIGLAIALALKVSLLDAILPIPPATPPSPVRDWRVASEAVAAVGTLTGISLGATVGLERALPANFSVRGGLLGLAGWNKTIEPVRGSFTAELVAVEVDACVRWDVGVLTHVAGCAGFLTGALFAEGRGFPSSRTAALPWSAVTNVLGLARDLTDRWSLEAELAVILPLARTTVGAVSADGSVVASRDLSAPGGALAVGPRYRF